MSSLIPWSIVYIFSTGFFHITEGFKKVFLRICFRGFVYLWMPMVILNKLSYFKKMSSDHWSFLITIFSFVLINTVVVFMIVFSLFYGLKKMNKEGPSFQTKRDLVKFKKFWKD